MMTNTMVYFVIACVAGGEHDNVAVRKILSNISFHLAHVIPHGFLWVRRVSAENIAGFCNKKTRDGEYAETFRV